MIHNRLSAISLLLITLTGCQPNDTYVWQSIDRDGSVNSGTAMITVVVFNGHVIKSYIDDIDIITDSIVLLRQAQGEELLFTVKKLKR